MCIAVTGKEVRRGPPASPLAGSRAAPELRRAAAAAPGAPRAAAAAAPGALSTSAAAPALAGNQSFLAFKGLL